MDISALRQDATEAAFDAFGIDVELLQGGSIAADKTVGGIWVQPVTATDLGGFDLQSDRPSRVLALKKIDAPKLGRGDLLRTQDGVGGRLKVFRVDAPVEIFSDHFRLQLVPDDTTTTRRGGGSKKEVSPDRKPHRPKPTPPPHELKGHGNDE